MKEADLELETQYLHKWALDNLPTINGKKPYISKFSVTSYTTNIGAYITLFKDKQSAEYYFKYRKTALEAREEYGGLVIMCTANTIEDFKAYYKSMVNIPED